jgi:hypothetical protein
MHCFGYLLVASTIYAELDPGVHMGCIQLLLLNRVWHLPNWPLNSLYPVTWRWVRGVKSLVDRLTSPQLLGKNKCFVPVEWPIHPLPLNCPLILTLIICYNASWSSCSVWTWHNVFSVTNEPFCKYGDWEENTHRHFRNAKWCHLQSS